MYIRSYMERAAIKLVFDEGNLGRKGPRIC